MCIELCFQSKHKTTKRNDVIKLIMNTIEFSNVDEIVEMFEMRFANANVEMIESMRDELLHSFEKQFIIHVATTRQKTMHVDVDLMNRMIESHLRYHVATHYARNYAIANNEFANVVAHEIVSHNHATKYAIMNIDYENENVTTIAIIEIDKTLKIKIELKMN